MGDHACVGGGHALAHMHAHAHEPMYMWRLQRTAPNAKADGNKSETRIFIEVASNWLVPKKTYLQR